MSASFIIKPYSHEQVQVYYDLFKELANSQFPEYTAELSNYLSTHKRGYSRENWETYASNPYKMIYGAWSQDKLVGILIGSKDIGCVAMCAWLLVHPDYQKQTVGKNLLAHFESELKKIHFHTIYLYAPQRNIEYYKKMGFMYVAKIPRIWFGLDHHMFIKHIDTPDEKFFYIN